MKGVDLIKSNKFNAEKFETAVGLYRNDCTAIRKSVPRLLEKVERAFRCEHSNETWHFAKCTKTMKNKCQVVWTKRNVCMT